MSLESSLMDTSYDLELEKIKNKIKQLYENLLTKTYKMSNPQATPEEISSFLEENSLDFKGQGFEEEAEDLEELLENLSKEDDLDSVSEKTFEKPDVESGKELKSKSKDALTTPKTKPLLIAKGGLLTPPDFHTIPITKKLRTPTGKIKRVIDDAPKVSSKELKDIWDSERNRLVTLVHKRNKEYGVRL